jgi:hypothetical protein
MYQVSQLGPAPTPQGAGIFSDLGPMLYSIESAMFSAGGLALQILPRRFLGTSFLRTDGSASIAAHGALREGFEAECRILSGMRGKVLDLCVVHELQHKCRFLRRAIAGAEIEADEVRVAYAADQNNLRGALTISASKPNCSATSSASHSISPAARSSAVWCSSRGHVR